MARPVNEGKRKEKLEHILESARAVFCRKGFLDVSMQDIIDACGTSRGGIYLYFSSVEEIFLSVLSNRHMSRSDGFLRSIGDNMDFFQLLDRYFEVQKHRLLHMEDSLLRATYEYLFTHKGEEAREFQSVQSDQMRAAVRGILELGARQRAIRDENLPALAEHILCLIEGLGVLALTGGLTETHVDQQFGLLRGQLLEQGALSGLAGRDALRVLVTAGDTSEQIDHVRKIVNPATGRLGSLVADMFALAGARVTYIGGTGARWPTRPMEHIHTVEDVRQLSELMKTLLKETSFDCVVHSMSVSEYTLRTITTADKLAADIAADAAKTGGASVEEIARRTIRQADDSYIGKRLPPGMEGMVLVMDPAPRIMARIRRLRPQSILVGFKLLVDVDHDDLVQAAADMIRQERCDFVLANDMEDITDTRHKAVLVSDSGDAQELDTKQEIAQAIVKFCLERYRQRDEEGMQGEAFPH